MADIRMRTVAEVDLTHLDEFKQLIADAVADSLAEVGDVSSDSLGYSAHLDETTGRMVLFEHHGNMASFLDHLATNPDRRARLRTICQPAGPTEIYGEPPDQLLQLLRTMNIDFVTYRTELGVVGEL